MGDGGADIEILADVGGQTGGDAAKIGGGTADGDDVSHALYDACEHGVGGVDVKKGIVAENVGG